MQKQNCGELLLLLVDGDFIAAYLSLRPNREKCTYRFGCAFKSMSSESADFMVLLKLL